MSGRSAGSSLSYRGRQCRYKNIYFPIGRGTKSKALVPRKDRRAMARNNLDRSDVTQIKLTFVDSGQNNKDRIMICRNRLEYSQKEYFGEEEFTRRLFR